MEFIDSCVFELCGHKLQISAARADRRARRQSASNHGIACLALWPSRPGNVYRVALSARYCTARPVRQQTGLQALSTDYNQNHLGPSSARFMLTSWILMPMMWLVAPSYPRWSKGSSGLLPSLSSTQHSGAVIAAFQHLRHYLIDSKLKLRTD